MKLVAIDPSGNFSEGKGITGIASFIDGYPSSLSEVKAEDYDSAPAYWNAVLNRLSILVPDIIVCEAYPLYAHKAQTQSYSTLETPQLIGCITLWAWVRRIPVVFQTASMVKGRWNDDVLVHKGYLERKGNRLLFDGVPTNAHKRDALRHGLYYIKKQEREKK